MISEDSVYKIGTITRTHGVHGEVVMSFTDDVWDRAEAEYLVLRIDGILVPFFLEEYRFRSECVALLKFLDYDTADAAEELRGVDVYFPFDCTPERNAEDPYEWRSLVGFRVVDAQRGELGVVDRVDDRTANVLLCIGSRLIPAAEDFVQEVDFSKRTILMNLPEGLLDL